MVTSITLKNAGQFVKSSLQNLLTKWKAITYFDVFSMSRAFIYTLHCKYRFLSLQKCQTTFQIFTCIPNKFNLYYIQKEWAYTFLHSNKRVMKHPDSAIQHLDGTMYTSKMSSHCMQEKHTNSNKKNSLNHQIQKIKGFHQIGLSLFTENPRNKEKKKAGLHWVAAEPPSDGFRWATWSTEILSASTVCKAQKRQPQRSQLMKIKRNRVDKNEKYEPQLCSLNGQK